MTDDEGFPGPAPPPSPKPSAPSVLQPQITACWSHASACVYMLLHSARLADMNAPCLQNLSVPKSILLFGNLRWLSSVDLT